MAHTAAINRRGQMAPAIVLGPADFADKDTKRLTLSQVPKFPRFPDHIYIYPPQERRGFFYCVIDHGKHRWRVNKDGSLAIYIEYYKSREPEQRSRYKRLYAPTKTLWD